MAGVTNTQYNSIRKHFLTWFVEYLTARGIEDTEVWSALDNALERYRRPIQFRLSKLARRLGGALRSLGTAVRSEGGS